MERVRDEKEREEEKQKGERRKELGEDSYIGIVHTKAEVLYCR
jgi:hypothetical protein